MGYHVDIANIFLQIKKSFQAVQIKQSRTRADEKNTRAKMFRHFLRKS